MTSMMDVPSAGRGHHDAVLRPTRVQDASRVRQTTEPHVRPPWLPQSSL